MVTFYVRPSVDVCLAFSTKWKKRDLEKHAKQIRNTIARLINLAMNGYLPHHGFLLNFVRNPCSVGFIHPPSVSAQYVSPGHGGQFALAQHQLQNRIDSGQFATSSTVTTSRSASRSGTRFGCNSSFCRTIHLQILAATIKSPKRWVSKRRPCN